MFQHKILTIICAAVLAVGIGSTAGVIAAKNETPAAKKSAGTTGGAAVSISIPAERYNKSTDASAQQEEESAESALSSSVTESTSANETGSTSSAITLHGMTTEPTGQEKESSSSSASTSAKISGYAYAYAGLNPAYANMNVSNWELILVNRNYILPDNYTPSLSPAVSGGNSNGQQLDSRVAPHYSEMYYAALQDGITLTPVSGYRSVTRQRNNFENKINAYMSSGYSREEATLMAAERILPPGTSEHNAGFAMDIITADSTANFQNTAAYRWLDAHAAEYGFILRYPQNKQSITEIIYEPWHWRYVGVSAAKAMKQSGQCLEEYLGIYH